jgi:hypothetical protein
MLSMYENNLYIIGCINLTRNVLRVDSALENDELTAFHIILMNLPIVDMIRIYRKCFLKIYLK